MLRFLRHLKPRPAPWNYNHSCNCQRPIVVLRLHKPLSASTHPLPNNPGNSFPLRYSSNLSFSTYSTTTITMSAASTSVHPVADAFSTSGSSGLYDRARPSYPPEALSKVFTALHSSIERKSDKDRDDGLNILELGSGTGIFTRLLVSPPEISPPIPKISKLVAVEPSHGMREGFTASLISRNIPVGEVGTAGAETVQVVHGTFDSIPAEDNWADAVVIAQAFHWSHGHYENTLNEISRVLRPGAPLILIWNMEDRNLPEVHPWVPKVRDVYEQYEKGTPQYRLGWWKAIFDMEEYKRGFKGDYEVYEFKRTIPTTVDAVVLRVLSKSYITALDDEERAQVEKTIREIIGSEKKQWEVEEKGIFEYPYVTDLYIIWRK